MTKLTSVALLAAAVLPVSGMAAVPVATAQQGEATRLAALLTPEPALTGLAGRAFEAGFEAEFGKDAEAQRLYAAHPGLKDHVASRMRSEVVDLMMRNLPSLRADLGGIIASDLTPAEIEATTVFFESQTGQKLFAQVFKTLGESPTADQAAAQQKAMTAVMESMTPEDYPALMAFGASSAAAKMSTLNPKIAAASKAWAERLLNEHGATIRAKAATLAADYVAANPAPSGQ